jgi:hypothetical protein
MKDQYMIEHSPDGGTTWNITHTFDSLTAALRKFEVIVLKDLDSWRLTAKENK